MPLPKEAVTLSVEQVREFNQKLADLRHDVNNSLSLMTATVELIKRRPQSTENLLEALIEQPRRINAAIVEFSRDFEQALRITKP